MQARIEVFRSGASWSVRTNGTNSVGKRGLWDGLSREQALDQARDLARTLMRGDIPVELVDWESGVPVKISPEYSTF